MSETTTETMNQNAPLIRRRLEAPRAAAIAGIAFSLLLITSLVLIRIAVPANPLEAGNWLVGNAGQIALALNLIPFAGIACLWFIGVIRDRIGDLEDRFFATVFLGSGLLFLAMTFVGAAVMGSLILAYGDNPARLISSGSYAFGRAISYQIVNIYAMKMAGVFIIATSTLALRTGITPRWMAITGYAVALVLLVTLGLFEWISLVFPLWVLMISVYTLVANMRGRSGVEITGQVKATP